MRYLKKIKILYHSLHGFRAVGNGYVYALQTTDELEVNIFGYRVLLDKSILSLMQYYKFKLYDFSKHAPIFF